MNKDINLKIDQTLFEIAIRNLLDNAIKYSPTENDVDVTLEINGDDYLIKFMNISLNKLNFDFKNIMKRFSRGNKNEKVIATFNDGESFGEIALFTNTLRSVTAKSVGKTTL